jgi:hypothetical protein
MISENTLRSCMFWHSLASEAGIFQWWSHSRCNSGILLHIPGIT